jgi:type II secretory pathway pseudopilin PulG
MLNRFSTRCYVLAVTPPRSGITLVEVMFIMLIVGIASVAMLGFAASATRANSKNSDLVIATSIARSAHEWATAKQYVGLQEQFSTIAAGNGVKTWAPTVLLEGSGDGTTELDPGHGALASRYAGWTEVLTARQLNPGNLLQADSSGTSRVTELSVAVANPQGGTVCHILKLYAKY